MNGEKRVKIESSVQIIDQVIEEKDRFIFHTIVMYLQNNEEISSEMTDRLVVSKKILVRAMQCFIKEHSEEYQMLMKEVD